jgi:receptor protein-tyrosine kinase
MSESFRQIKRPLLMNARQRRSPVQRATLIMVTSALPGEGKTFVATNLAMSLAAEVDTSVLLVDADVIRPTLLSRLGVRAELGLLDVLTRDDLDVESLIVPTNVPKLSLLSSGSPHPLSTEMLASRALESLLMTLVSRDPDRIVVFDVPPLLVASEAQVLASRVGQVVMVVEASRTPSSSVAQAFAMLEDCPVVMSVLNKAPESPIARGHDYFD